MEWTNTLTVSHLFLTHDVVVNGPDGQYVVHIPSLREYLDSSFYTQLLQLFSDEQLEVWRKTMPKLDKSSLLQMLMTEPRITNLKEFSTISKQLHANLKKVLPNFTIRDRRLYSGESPLTDEALTEILYILSLGIGKRVERPQHFGPDEQAAKLFYERARAARAKADKIKAENPQQSDRDSLMDMFVMISYRFPYTFENMYDMTLMQLHYLQRMSSQMVSYENAMDAYTAGNLKKAPQFFLK